MKNQNLKKRIIAGGCVGVLTFGIVGAALLQNASDVLAKQNVFHEIKTYQDNGLKILEITPTDDDVDFGYFVSRGNGDYHKANDACYGNILLKRAPFSFDDPNGGGDEPTPGPATMFSTKAEYQNWMTDAKRTAIRNSITAANYPNLQDYVNAYSGAWGALQGDPWTDFWNNYPYGKSSTVSGANDAYDVAIRSAIVAMAASDNVGIVADYGYLAYLNQTYAIPLPDNAGGGGGGGDITTLSAEDKEKLTQALGLRQYGLIKPWGADLVPNTLSEYPIYLLEGKDMFARATGSSNDFRLIQSKSTSVVSGHYVKDPIVDGANSYYYYSLDVTKYVVGPEDLDPSINAIDGTGQPITKLLDTYIYEYSSKYIYDEMIAGETPAIPEWLTKVNGNTGTYKFVADEDNFSYYGILDTVDKTYYGTINFAPGTGHYNFADGDKNYTFNGAGAGYFPDDVSTDAGKQSYLYNSNNEQILDDTDQPIQIVNSNDLPAGAIIEYVVDHVDDNGTPDDDTDDVNVYRFIVLMENGALTDADNPVIVPVAGDTDDGLISFVPDPTEPEVEDNTKYSITVKEVNTDETTFVKGYYTAATDDAKITYNLKPDDEYKNIQLCDGEGTMTLGEGEEIADGTEEFRVHSFYDKQFKLVFTRIDSTEGIPEFISYNPAGDGNINFTYLPNYRDHYWGWESEEMYVRVQNDKYRVGPWLQEYILGDHTQNYSITYTHKTLSNVTEADIDAYDLIYISGRAEEYADENVGDMSAALVKKIYEESALHNKAVMMDYALYSNETDNDKITNIDKLCLLLWQEDQKLPANSPSYEDYFRFDIDHEVIGIDSIDALLADGNLMDGLRGMMLSGYNGNFAYNNVYVYDHSWKYFLSSKLEDSQTDAHDVFANGDIANPYISAAITTGFSQVVEYIAYNNGLPDNGDENGTMTEGYVTPAIAIQFILCYRGEKFNLSKGQFKVLEIEPTKEFRFNDEYDQEKPWINLSQGVKDNRNAFIEDCIDSKIVNDGTQDTIAFRSMTIEEFNTINVDVLHDYDLVYIGSEHSKYFFNCGAGNTSSYNPNTKKYENNSNGGFPCYAHVGKSALDGAVYYNSGYFTYGNNQSAGHYAPRDLSGAKLKLLKNYLEKNGLIIVSSDIMYTVKVGDVYTTVLNPTMNLGNTGNITDYGRVDTSSNMYELLKYARGSRFDSAGGIYTAEVLDEEGNVASVYNNLVSERDLGNGIVTKDSLKIYLNRERVRLNMLETPTTYFYNGTADVNNSYLAPSNIDNRYYISCQFSIESTAGLETINDVYLIHYYQDKNCDGQFTEEEEIKGFNITLANSNVDIGETNYEGGVTAYNLKANTVYDLKRQVPSDEGGYINWCIRVEKESAPDINAIASGSTVVRPRDKKYINVLQIMPRDTANVTRSTVNLEHVQNGNNTDNLKEYLFEDPAVTDKYVINVRSISTSQFESDTSRFYNSYNGNGRSEDEIWAEYFNSFQRVQTNPAIFTSDQIEADVDSPMNVNMIVLGFGDYQEVNNELGAFSRRALLSYLDTNKPLLTSYRAITNITGGISTTSFSLRPYFGMDRFGKTIAPGNKALYGEDYSLAGNAAYYGRTEGLIPQYIMGSGGTGDREGNKKAVAYLQNTERTSVYAIEPGYTNYFSASRRSAAERDENRSYMNGTAAAGIYNPGGDDFVTNATRTGIDIANYGQVSNYPYTVADGALVSKTYSDYYQIDIDTDSSTEGDRYGYGIPDITVWCTLGNMTNDAGASVSDVFWGSPRDGANNYYIYNYGNVTYTGYGRNGLAAQTNSEKMLFVNTLIAAYESGLNNPTVNYYAEADSNSEIINSVVVPYDGNITKHNTVDSSILLDNNDEYMYKFVNPNTNAASIGNGTKAFFKVQDSNFIRGDNKNARIFFYLGAPNGYDVGDVYNPGDGDKVVRAIQLNDNTVVKVVPITIDIYRIANYQTDEFGDKIARSAPNASLDDNPYIDVGTMYGIYLPMSYLSDRGTADIYIQADTSYTVVDGSTGAWKQRPLGTAYNLLSEIKQDLLKLD